MNCATCGHEEGCHRRKDWSMGRCCFRPRVKDGNPRKPRIDFKAPPCQCQKFVRPEEKP